MRQKGDKERRTTQQLFFAVVALAIGLSCRHVPDTPQTTTAIPSSGIVNILPPVTTPQNRVRSFQLLTLQFASSTVPTETPNKEMFVAFGGKPVRARLQADNSLIVVTPLLEPGPISVVAFTSTGLSSAIGDMWAQFEKSGQEQFEKGRDVVEKVQNAISDFVEGNKDQVLTLFAEPLVNIPTADDLARRLTTPISDLKSAIRTSLVSAASSFCITDANALDSAIANDLSVVDIAVSSLNSRIKNLPKEQIIALHGALSANNGYATLDAVSAVASALKSYTSTQSAAEWQMFKMEIDQLAGSVSAILNVWLVVDFVLIVVDVLDGPQPDVGMAAILVHFALQVFSNYAAILPTHVRALELDGVAGNTIELTTGARSVFKVKATYTATATWPQATIKTIIDGVGARFSAVLKHAEFSEYANTFFNRFYKGFYELFTDVTTHVLGEKVASVMGGNPASCPQEIDIGLFRESPFSTPLNQSLRNRRALHQSGQLPAASSGPVVSDAVVESNRAVFEVVSTFSGLQLNPKSAGIATLTLSTWKWEKYDWDKDQFGLAKGIAQLNDLLNWPKTLLVGGTNKEDVKFWADLFIFVEYPRDSLKRVWTVVVKDRFERECGDGLDNDKDSKTDCQDLDCDGQICSSGGARCNKMRCQLPPKPPVDSCDLVLRTKRWCGSFEARSNPANIRRYRRECRKYECCFIKKMANDPLVGRGRYKRDCDKLR